MGETKETCYLALNHLCLHHVAYDHVHVFQFNVISPHNPKLRNGTGMAGEPIILTRCKVHVQLGESTSGVYPYSFCNGSLPGEFRAQRVLVRWIPLDSVLGSGLAGVLAYVCACVCTRKFVP